MNKFFAFILLTVFISCNQKDAQQGDVIDTVVYDTKAIVQSAERSIGDGFYDFVILGTNFKGQNGLNLFLLDAKLSRASLMYWFNTFEPQYKVDTNKIRVWYRNCKGNFNCSGGGLNEGVACNFNKIKSEVESIEKEFNFKHDKIGILGNELGGGGGGQGYFFTGLGAHLPNPPCTFEQAAYDGKMWHELLHEYDIRHVDTVWNKAAGVFTTNGCCGIWNAPILPYHQELIKEDFDLKTQ